MRWILPLLIACKREPELQWIEVTAQLPGATAERVAEQVATPIEHVVGQVKGVEALTSESHRGFTLVHVGATDDLENAVREALVRPRGLLPSETSTPAIFQAQGPIVARLAVPVGQGEATARKIEMLEGVAQVERCDPGDAPLRFAVDAAKLAASGLTVTDVYAAAMAAREQPLAVVVKRGVTVGDLVAKLPAAPPCRARIRGAETALLEVRAQRGVSGGLEAAVSRFGTLLPPLEESAGPMVNGDAFAVISRTGEPDRLLVEPTAQLAGAILVLTAADPALLATTARELATRLGAVATRGMTTTSEKTIELDRDRAAELGVDVADLAQALALSMDEGVAVTSGTPEIRLVATGPLRVRSRRLGSQVAVEDFEKLTERQTLREVLHVGQLPAVRLYLRAQVEVGALPAGVTATWSRTIAP